MQQHFVHLRLHTDYSIIDGLIRVKPLIQAVLDNGMSCVAITDFCNLFAVVKFFKAAIAKGVKPIIGADFLCSSPFHPDKLTYLSFLCQNKSGYRNLTCLVSKAYQEGQQKGLPIIKHEWIKEHAEGLIALSGGTNGSINQCIINSDIEGARNIAEDFMRIFPTRFYLEITRLNNQQNKAIDTQLIHLADKLKLPLVATNDVRFLQQEEFEAHEARVCIHDGFTLADSRRLRVYTTNQYLKTPKEMSELFSDLPQAITNTVEIAKRCNVKIELGAHYLPDFPSPNGFSMEQYLQLSAKEGLQTRLIKIFQDKPQKQIDNLRKPFDERLETELAVIIKMGFAGYFLIVADFIAWARANKIAVGPGRGSGAGSLVAYALKITDLNPLQYDLLFERFLNPERVSMPDFDIDFCMHGRDRVIEYVAMKYGRQAVSQIITFGTMAAKAVVRDVGRVQGHPYPFVDKIAKLIPFELGMTLSKALEDEKELQRRYQDEEEVKDLIDLALLLEGLTRNAGKHAGGVVIAPTKLTDFTAIYCEEGSSQIVSQLDKDDVEAVGLVKFDFLGLKTLTIIDLALKIINHQRSLESQAAIDITEIPLNDNDTFKQLKEGNTTAIFQLESRGMKELIHRLHPHCFEEIIALVALFRPGPLQSGMVDDFINRKHGRAKIVYFHPDLEPILKPTYGVILYQEQVMQIAQVLANYTLGSADLLRRAMGKKNKEEMEQQRSQFTLGASARGIEEHTANHIFDLMEKFAGYGFNKSHSAAYALLAYQTAWLKTWYPAAFMAAVLSCDMDNTDKIVIFINECMNMELTVLAPSVNRADLSFISISDKQIIYGLGAIKGVGDNAITCIVNERENGPYTGLFDFCQRLDLRKVNRRVLEALIKSGAMDEFGISRASLHESLEKAVKIAEKSQQNQANGQQDLFSLFEESNALEDYIICQDWPEIMRLNAEKEVLGLYLTGHPTQKFCVEFKIFINNPIYTLNPTHIKKAFVFGLVTTIKRIITKTGKQLVILTIEDSRSKLDVVVFQELMESQKIQIHNGMMLLVEGEIANDAYSGGIKMTARLLYSIEEARSRFAKSLFINLTSTLISNDIINALEVLFNTNPGLCIVQIRYTNTKTSALLTLAKQWRVSPSDDLILQLAQITGDNNVNLIY